jgi:hypothetical protein
MRGSMLFLQTKQLHGRITDKLVVAKLVQYSRPLFETRKLITAFTTAEN